MNEAYNSFVYQDARTRTTADEDLDGHAAFHDPYIMKMIAQSSWHFRLITRIWISRPFVLGFVHGGLENAIVAIFVMALPHCHCYQGNLCG
jgi:hypothetical protein